METDLLNQIKQQSVLLSLPEKQDLADFLARQVQNDLSELKQSANGSKPNKIRILEREWLNENRAAFAGQWVALDGDELLSHGTDGRQVYVEAKAKGVKVPFVVHLEAEDELPFGGW
jgi:predicted exporter